ncbi:unnamed protein product [Symbiodinium sp. CCMP2456]|nr:unnamed protein product [Symbiodinium sp. CCMP2456]
MYDDVQYVLKLKDMGIERAYGRLSCAEKDRAEQVYTKMIELLKQMEGQIYKILRTENPWFNAQVRKTRRWLQEQPGEAACVFIFSSAFVSGCLGVLCEFGVHPFYWAGLVKAPLSVAAMFGVGAVGGACLGALFVTALHYCLSTDCWVFLTDTSKSHVADINRMVQATYQVEDDKFLESLDEILKSMAGFSGAVPDVPDRLCQICLEEGHNVVAPVKAPRCQGSHFMCKQHWKRYVENFDDRCPQPKTCSSLAAFRFYEIYLSNILGYVSLASQVTKSRLLHRDLGLPHLPGGRAGEAGEEFSFYGLLAAGGVALQGVALLDPAMTLQTMLHLAGALVFFWASWCHTSAAAKLYLPGWSMPAEESPEYQQVVDAMEAAEDSKLLAVPAVWWLVRIRHKVLMRGPLAMFIGPLVMQFLERSQDRETGMAQSPRTRNWMGILQWLVVANFALIFFSYGPELAIAAMLPLPQED